MTEPTDITNLTLKKGDAIHLIGIGGSGMNGLADCLLFQKYRITGSDLQMNQSIRQLRRRGARIAIGHSPNNLPAKCRLVVKSAAIKDDNPEVQRARQRRIPVIKYAQMLGLLMRDRCGIAVSGCHGKTTTSALMAYVLDRAKQRPSFVIGGHVTDLDASARLTKGKYLVAEACEYDRSFHNLFYKIAVINNIETDHLDYYKDLNEIIDSFRTFAQRLPPDGMIIANADDRNVQSALAGLNRPVITFGLAAKSDWMARNIKITDNRWYFGAYYQNRFYGTFRLGIPGIHNVANALAVMAVAHYLELPKTVLKKALADFHGAGRRFQFLGLVNEAAVIDDYGHHPTELKAVLKTARQVYPDKKIRIVFQPHQAHRTRLFLDEFAEVLQGADEVIIADIYYARDSAAEKRKINAQTLVRRINQKKGNARYLGPFPEIIKYLQNHLTERDVVVTMGAGNVWEIAHNLVNHK